MGDNMKFFKRFLIFTLCFSLVMPLLLFDSSASDNKYGGAASENIYGGEYTNYHATPVESHLTKDGNDFLRTEYNFQTGKITEERYSSDFSLISSVSVEPELPVYGGIYKDANENYVVTGNLNSAEDPDAEVIRITKYSKNWEFLSRASVYGENTETPFRSGSVRFLKCGDTLYVDTSHRMFKYSDGKNHQSNMLITLDTANMEIKYVRSGVSNVSTGYVSHSFNQFIVLDEDSGSVITADHGDAHPRSVALCKFQGEAGNYELSDAISANVFDFAGETGVNDTYCSVGGLAVAKDNYIVSLSSVDQSKTNLEALSKNVYITLTPKDNFSEGSTKTAKLTNYNDGELSAGTPKLITLDSDRFLVIWNNQAGGNKLCDGTVSYVVIDGNGNKLSDIFTDDGKLSDCDPVLSNNKVYWYVTDKSTPAFYSIDINNPGNVKVEKQGHRTETYHIDDNKDGACDICENYIPTENPSSKVVLEKNIYNLGESVAYADIITSGFVNIANFSTSERPWSCDWSTTTGQISLNIEISDYGAGFHTFYAKLSTGEVLAIDVPITKDGKEPLDILPLGDDVISLNETTTKPAERETTTLTPSTVPDNSENMTDNTEGEIMKGDLDGDLTVTASDARMALRISARLEKGTFEQLNAADADGDARITAEDARKILRVAARLENF